MRMLNVSVLSIAVSLLSVGGYAAEDPVGDWKGEGPRGEFTITIDKDADGKLTGEMVTGRGANDLSNFESDGANLSFTNLLEFNGQSVELNFAGKISANTFTGTISTPRGEREVSLTRAVTGVAGLVGTWKLTGESQYGPMDHTLTVGDDGAGTYGSNGDTSKVTNLEVDGTNVAFSMTVFGGGNSYDMSFKGSYNDNALTGDLMSQNGSSFTKLTAPRMKGLAQWAGTWNLKGEAQFGPMEHILIIAPDGKATYGSNDEVSDVTNVKIDGNKIDFDMTVYGGPGSYDVAFKGNFDGDNLVGDIISNGSSFAELKASKQ